MKYQLVACGGTFDRFHQGHKDFLNFAINLGKKVILGLTSDLYIKHYKNNLGVMPFEERKKILEEHLDFIQKLDQLEIISIDDHFGPTLCNEYPFDCLAVTESTEEMGAQINDQRRKKGMNEFPLEVFNLTLAKDGKPITSTRIRNGEIDREGKLYIKKEWLNHDLVLPEALRDELSEPLGEIIQEIPQDLDSSKIITVGDMVTKTFKEKGLDLRLSIVDLRVEREDRYKNIQDLGFSGNEEIVRVKNPAGTISSRLINEILRCTQDDKSKKTIIIIDGEEDLAVLPVILAAPLGFQIFYGQPGKGMVQVNTFEETKNKVRALLEKFDTK